MPAPMTFEQAEAVVRTPVVVGKRYRFYSTLQGPDGYGVYCAEYSAQEVLVVKVTRDETTADDWGDNPERMFEVRANDGAVFSAWEGELNGWFFDTGQWHGPEAAAIERFTQNKGSTP